VASRARLVARRGARSLTGLKPVLPSSYPNRDCILPSSTRRHRRLKDFRLIEVSLNH
jgi:hypothetical protein